MAIKDGKVYKPDSDGIIWIDGRGYKPQSLTIGPGGEPREDLIPSLSERPINIQEIAYKLKQSVGGYEAYMGIGWVVATIFSDDIFAKFKCMPILFPHGKRESGKSTFMRWLMSFFGIETEGISVGKTTTQNFIARILSYRSCLGVWFDEYRNENGVIEKDGLFRSVWNRQFSGKGTPTNFQTKGFTVNASVAISGEELPRDNGLFTRCVPLQISAYKRDRTWYDWLNINSIQFSGYVYHLLMNYELYKPKIIKTITELKALLVSRQVTDRTAENWAICAGAFDAVVLQDDEFIRWVERSCQEIKKTGEQEHILNQFWDSVNFLVNEGDISRHYFLVEDNTLFFWFPGVFEKWALHYKKQTGREPFDKQSILKYLQDEPYFIGPYKKRIIEAGKAIQRRGYLINLDKATETIKEIAEVIANHY
jgi:DNA primase